MQDSFPHHFAGARSDVPHLAGAAIAAGGVVKGGRDLRQPPGQPVLPGRREVGVVHPGFQRPKQGAQLGILVDLAAVGLVAVGDEQGVALVPQALFHQGLRFGSRQFAQPGLLDGGAQRRIPDPPLPGRLGRPGPHARVGVPVEGPGQKPGQAGLVETGAGQYRIGAHPQSLKDGFPHPVVAGLVGLEEFFKPSIVQQRLFRGPGGRIPNHLDRVAHGRDQRVYPMPAVDTPQPMRPQ